MDFFNEHVNCTPLHKDITLKPCHLRGISSTVFVPCARRSRVLLISTGKSPKYIVDVLIESLLIGTHFYNLIQSTVKKTGISINLLQKIKYIKKLKKNK